MCGIYGMVALRGTLTAPEAADRLAAAVAPRGPDAHRRHATPHAIIGVHRLRVVDLSPEADQPFTGDGVTLAVNGEIYNARDLLARFPAFRPRSRADGEALLPLLGAGEPRDLSAVAGMFALARWDDRARTLILARDAAGEKPLFYARHGHEVWFASRPDVLHPRPAVDDAAAAEFLALGVVRPPRTVFRDVHMVEPGTAVVITPEHQTVIRYDTAPPADPATSLTDALERAVERQCTADVPLGVFLSGGLDSTLVAHLAARHRPGLTAFTVGFDDPSFDERPWARRAARDLGLPLVEVTASDSDLLRAREASLALGEPIADPAIMPTILLAERARQDVTVVLSGEGADELFGGYPTYVAHRLASLPLLAPAARVAALVLPSRHGRRMPAAWLLRRFADEARRPMVQRHVAWFGGAVPPDALTRNGLVNGMRCVGVPDVMELDRTVWLPNRLLTKLDRATMRVGLEARAPFLDPAVVALARGRTDHVGRLAGKRVLKRIARGRVPGYILRRGKRGMSVPVGRLLNGPLRAEADRLLEPGRLARHGLVRPRAVARLVTEHRAGRADHGRALWTLFTLEAWRERHDT